MRALFFLFIGMINFKSCSEFVFLAKGNFLESQYDYNGSNFQVEESEKNDIRKIYEHGLSYYSWKTIAINQIDSTNDVEFPYVTYRTITNDEIEASEGSILKKIQTKSQVYENYLFFIDSFRVIYLSQDVDRKDQFNPLFSKILNIKSSMLQNDLFLYFDNENYRLTRADENVYRQMVRGYYYTRGDKLFIDFEEKGKIPFLKELRLPFLKNKPIEHFYLKGTVDKEAISIDSISISFHANHINADLLSQPYYSITDDYKLPRMIFELPKTDLIKSDSVGLIIGFKNYKSKDTTKMNDLHVAFVSMLKSEGITYNNKEAVYIKDIKYNYCELNKRLPCERVYKCEYRNNVYFLTETLKSHEDQDEVLNSTW